MQQQLLRRSIGQTVRSSSRLALETFEKQTCFDICRVMLRYWTRCLQAVLQWPSALVHWDTCHICIRHCEAAVFLANAIVTPSCRRQAVAGLFAAGAWRSAQYGAAKVAKFWRSQR